MSRRIVKWICIVMALSIVMPVNLCAGVMADAGGSGSLRVKNENAGEKYADNSLILTRLSGIEDGNEFCGRLVSNHYVAQADIISELPLEGSLFLQFVKAEISDGIDAREAADKLRSAYNIISAEPNYICTSLSGGSCDETYGQELEAKEIFREFPDEQSWHLDAINAKTSWDTMEGRGMVPGAGVTVAVIDSGVSVTHPDLEENIFVNEKELNGIKDVDDDGNGYVDDINGVDLTGVGLGMTDSYGHGTQMAGIIAGKRKGDAGIGIAYGAKILPVRIGTGKDFGTDLAIEGITYAVENGADILNLSFGTENPSVALESVIRWAAEKCVIAAAAGNEKYATESDNVTPMTAEQVNEYPAGYDCVIGVMASSEDDKLASYSCWDCEPGAGADYEVIACGDKLLSTHPGKRYATLSGTSHATAVVSGLLAVFRQLFPDRQKIHPKALRTLFLEALGEQEYRIDGVDVSYHRADMKSLLVYAKDNELIEDTIPPVIENMTDNYEVSGRIVKFKAKITDNLAIKEAMLYYIPKGETKSMSTRMISDGDIYTAELPTTYLDEGDFYYWIVATDGVNEAEVHDYMHMLPNTEGKTLPPKETIEPSERPVTSFEPATLTPPGATPNPPGPTTSNSPEPDVPSPPGQNTPTPSEPDTPNPPEPVTSNSPESATSNSPEPGTPKPPEPDVPSPPGQDTPTPSEPGTLISPGQTGGGGADDSNEQAFEKMTKLLAAMKPSLKVKRIKVKSKNKYIVKTCLRMDIANDKKYKSLEGKISGFEIYRGTRKNGRFKRFASTKKKKYICKHNKKRYYKIRAYIKQGKKKYYSKNSKTRNCK